MDDQYFENLLECLEFEKREEEDIPIIRQIEKTIRNQDHNPGIWCPVQIIGLNINDRSITFRNNGMHRNEQYHFKTNTNVRVINFNRSMATFGFVIGQIARFGKNTMKVIIQHKYLISNTSFPSWLNKNNFHILICIAMEMPFYRDIRKSLLKIKNEKYGRIQRFKRILTKNQFSSFHNLPESTESKIRSLKLDESQKEAVRKILETKDVVLIQGPPGTGKTHTLIEAIKLISEIEKAPILVTAPSNLAVDVLLERLSVEYVNGRKLGILRIGDKARISLSVHEYLLDHQLKGHLSYSLYSSMGEAINEIEFSYKEKNDLLKNLIEDLKEDKELLRKEIETDIISKADVVAVTIGSSYPFINNMKFSYTIVDEAAQAIEFKTWGHIINTDKFVLVGDHEQLGPVIKSKYARNKGAAVSMFENIFSSENSNPEGQNGCMLQKQYRMNNKIIGFSNMTFYDNELQSDKKVAEHTLFKDDDSIHNEPIEFYDTSDRGFGEIFSAASATSYSNPKEADFILEHLEKLIHYTLNYKDQNNSILFSVGIISPYQDQIEYLNKKMSEFPNLNDYRNNITINTVDGFQGQERDIIYISLVRSNENGIIGFLEDRKRANVAITRARKKLVVVGDVNTFKKTKNIINKFIEYCDGINSLYK